MKKIIMIVILAIILCGCGDATPPYTDADMTMINISLGLDTWLVLPVPNDEILISTDGVGVWNFESGHYVMKYSGTNHIEFTPNTEYLYVDKDSNNTISVVGGKSWLKYLSENKYKIQVKKGTVPLEKDFQVGTWYSIEGLQYVDTEQGIMMPPGVQYQSWLMPVYKNGTDYLTTGLRYWNENEMYLHALSYLATYDKGKVHWEESDNYFIAHNDVVGIGYRKITVNKYVVFYSSADMFDYIILNTR